MYYVYILRLKDGSFYQGYSSNLKQRIEEHKSGAVSSTKNYRPFKLAFYAAFETKLIALRFEKYLKTNSGFAFRNKRFVDK
ncbi:MAG: GIY-YIG nuclease family protein [bacterium]|nr:GIY-YIG nuclease family protein [bacterium]